jgi:hypothetical protein
MKKFKKVYSVAVAAVLGLSLVACGAVESSNEVGSDEVGSIGESIIFIGSIDDQAAIRGIDEGVGQIFIDEPAIALAGEAEPSQPIKDACTAAFNLLNQQRAAQGLPALVRTTDLDNAAQVRANEIVGNFSHTRPGGAPFWTVNSNVQYGENLAKLYQSAESVHAAWMASPTHAANIMDAGYKTVGIAICQAADGGWYWAQEFGY